MIEPQLIIHSINQVPWGLRPLGFKVGKTQNERSCMHLKLNPPRKAPQRGKEQGDAEVTGIGIRSVYKVTIGNLKSLMISRGRGDIAFQGLFSKTVWKACARLIN